MLHTYESLSMNSVMCMCDKSLENGFAFGRISGQLEATVNRYIFFITTNWPLASGT